MNRLPRFSTRLGGDGVISADRYVHYFLHFIGEIKFIEKNLFLSYKGITLLSLYCKYVKKSHKQ